MPSKRPADDADVETAIQAAGIKDDDWIDKLLEVDEEQLILIVCDIVNRSIKKARTELPSSSAAKWTDFAARAGLPENPSYLPLGYFEAPVYQLPPSFHKAVFENSWRAQDVYQEAVELPSGESRVRTLDPYIVAILSLFQGRVIDKPEEVMPGTAAFSTGGEVEHEVIMIGGTLFFVIEAMSNKPSNNDLARLFLELLSTAKSNKEADFEGLCVYGILTNLTRFAFYSYDPISNKFCEDDEILVETLRDGFSSGMIHDFWRRTIRLHRGAACYLVKKSKQRVAKGDFSEARSPVRTIIQFFGPHSNLIHWNNEQSAKGERARKATEAWDLALNVAEECRKKFMEDVTTTEDMEIRSTEALELLTKR